MDAGPRHEERTRVDPEPTASPGFAPRPWARWLAVLRPPAEVLGLLPAVLLFASAVHLGTFDGAAHAAASRVGAWILLLLAPMGMAALARRATMGSRSRQRTVHQPVRRRDALSWIAGIAWVLVPWSILALSWARSPVPRAGLLAVVLLPAWLALPWALAHCGATERARQWRRRSVTLVVLLVASWSWLGLALGGSDRLALPLGHHNLLAAWLVLLVPVAASGARRRGVDRWLSISSTVAAISAILGSRSLAGVAALGAMLLAWAARVLMGRSPVRGPRWLRRLGPRRTVLGGTVLVGAVLVGTVLVGKGAALGGWVGPRLGAIFSGSDSSTLARLEYVRAAGRGFLERPWLGWGPGSFRFTAGEHLWPVPGLHPADQVVADPHGLYWLLSYELGLAGWLALLVLVWAGIRLSTTPPTVRNVSARNPGPARGPGRARSSATASLGLVGAAVLALGGWDAAVPALWWALATVVAFALGPAERFASAPVSPACAGSRRKTFATVGPWAWGLALLGALGAGVFLWPYQQAHVHAERGEWAAARELDPAFPLYGWRQALELGEGAPGHGEIGSDAFEDAAQLAWRAAHQARGLAPLWLTAARAAGTERAPGPRPGEQAAIRACDLSPLGALAPWWLAVHAEPDEPRAVDWAARAIVASPYLLAAVDWQGREGLRSRAVALLANQATLEAGWRAELVRLEAVVAEQARDEDERLEHSARRVLVSRADGEGATSLSLHVFRRRPDPVELARVELWQSAVEVLGALPPAADLASTERALFGEGCLVGAGPASREEN